ncbi:hypothetical protein MMAD_00860 [Mycolicibacterium madagascariense]|uniref:Uncharacterized protein n=1 Tax=Mycolicibacterium madagascariense TaxID=212765 RepID=A0A7I7XB09_9MYCO|nr:hypothetical protein [Mycolicibacterium madagascariense]MCV7014182.1 hypothetical protein [Mycolicibacterium madagascariense]BBZ25791.1 hypothetical protein MMAD_00860 [Mycolicibacterium madagascariense]
MSPTDDDRLHALMQPPATAQALRRETIYLLLSCYGLMSILAVVVYLWPR